MTNVTAVTTQQLKAEMALRLKCIKKGCTAEQVNLWSLDEVYCFLENYIGRNNEQA